MADEDRSITGVVELVKTYAIQQTIDPIKGAGQWIGYAAAGALLLGAGLSLLLLGLLRLIQTEWTWAATGSWSWISYLVVLLVGAGVIAIAVWRISATPSGAGTDSASKEGS
jgi:hypothetical protein